MLTGKYRGKSIGTSDVWRYHDDVREGKMEQKELSNIEAAMCRKRTLCRNGHGFLHGLYGRGVGSFVT